MLIFLHTSPLHVDRFNKVLDLLAFRGEVKHVVNEELLTFALKTGKIDSLAFANQIADFNLSTTKNKVLCTCSTYGQLTDEYENVYRVDEALAYYFVMNYDKIGLAYTVQSTFDISVNLLESIAKKLDKVITIESIDCTSSWSFFLNSDMASYNKSITEYILKKIDCIDAVFLAQASMDGVEGLIKTEKEVLSSTFLGVRKFIKE